MVRLGVRVETVSPDLAIPLDDAISLASREYDPKALGATSVDAFLETVSVRATIDTDVPLAERPVWIVKLSGMKLEQPGPVPQQHDDGSEPGMFDLTLDDPPAAAEVVSLTCEHTREDIAAVHKLAGGLHPSSRLSKH